jgi:peptide methionine sulfoxide reductase MsrB
MTDANARDFDSICDDYSDSGCGWPAFYEAIPGAVGRNVDRSMFMERIEIVCNNCTSGSSLTDHSPSSGFVELTVIICY